MATFVDLTPYVYSPWDEPMLNVGWLGAGSAFRRGPVPPGLVEALTLLAAAPKNVMRGYHYCELCGEASPILIPAPGERGQVRLGTGEIHVRRADGTLYSAPSLVVHYITAHGYQPPDGFVAAVLAPSGHGPG